MTKKEIAVKDKSTSVEKAVQPFMEITPADVKRYVCSAATDAEVGHFIRFCLSRRLNPFTKEAYLIKYSNQPAFIVIDVEKRIQPYTSHPSYAGFKAGLILDKQGDIEEVEGEFYLANQKILGSWCTVYRILPNGDKVPTTVRISFNEWSKNQAMWKSMPGRMIYKSAIIHAHRFAFPGTDLRNIPDEDVELTPEVLNISDDTELRKPEAIESDPTKRRAKFFKYMKDTHNLSDIEIIRERVSHVLGEQVSSINKFLFNDNQFMLFMDRDKNMVEKGQDAALDLFGGDMQEKPYEK